MSGVRPLAAVYLRISLDQTGEDLAVDRQRQDCMRILADREWELYGGEPYVDGVSASDRRTVSDD